MFDGYYFVYILGYWLVGLWFAVCCFGFDCVVQLAGFGFRCFDVCCLLIFSFRGLMVSWTVYLIAVFVGDLLWFVT